MTDLNKAIEVEKLNFPKQIDYKKLATLIEPYGYSNLTQYFDEKRAYLFSQWEPKIYYIPIEKFAIEVEEAIQNNQDGIYIPIGTGYHAYHGTDSIDLDLCKELNVNVIELNYNGGTIIGSSDDLSIEIIFPKIMSMNHPTMISKITEIISRYIPNCTYVGNDILINGEKICGSMTREEAGCFVWAAQITFNDYSELISKICNKPAIKKPSYIKSLTLTKEQLTKEILAWLKKEDIKNL